MNRIDHPGFAENAKRLRRELAEPKEMVRLGAGLPVDEQRMEMGKAYLTQWHALCLRRAENQAETHERPAEARLHRGLHDDGP